jgi:hypothetical protein
MPNAGNRIACRRLEQVGQLLGPEFVAHVSTVLAQEAHAEEDGAVMLDARSPAKQHALKHGQL